MKKKKWKREIPASEKGLPSILAKALDGIQALLERPSIAWSNDRTQIMDSRRVQACKVILIVMVMRTQLGLAGGVFELFKNQFGIPTYRPLNVRDLVRLTGLSESSFYRAWKELKKLGLVEAEVQKKKFVAPGQFRVTDVVRALTMKFWRMVGVGAEAFKRACHELSEKTKRLLETGKNAVIRVTRRVFSSPAQESSVKSQEKIDELNRSLQNEARDCWREKKARGEYLLDCHGCAKACSTWCQDWLNRMRADLAKSGLTPQMQVGFLTGH